MRVGSPPFCLFVELAAYRVDVPLGEEARKLDARPSECYWEIYVSVTLRGTQEGVRTVGNEWQRDIFSYGVAKLRIHADKSKHLELHDIRIRHDAIRIGVAVVVLVQDQRWFQSHGAIVLSSGQPGMTMNLHTRLNILT